jgi:L-fuconolactonase
VRIDAHQHFWKIGMFQAAWLEQPSHRAIRRDFLPADLVPHLQATGIDKTVFVQTQHDLAENRWVLGLADQSDFIAGVVGWIDLASPDCEQQLLDFRSHPKACGIRHVTHDEPDVNFIVRPDVLRGLKALEKHRVPFDLLFFVEHLPHAATVADHCPQLPLVIDHLAKPKIKQHSVADWEPAFRAAAKRPNVFCKLSGMITEADWKNWKPSDLKPYVEIALDCFGPGRLMFGTDWPVCELAGSYEDVHGTMVDLLSGLSAAEQARIFGGTAAEFYRLQESPRSGHGV